MAEKEDLEREKRVTLYKALLILTGGSVILLDTMKVVGQPFDYRWLILAALAVMGGWVASARIPGAGPIVTVSDAFVFLTMLLMGREYATLVAGISAFSDTLRHTKKWFTLAASIALTCLSYFISGSFIKLLFGNINLLEHQQQTFFLYVMALGLLAFVQSFVNTALVLTAEMLKTGTPIYKIWRDSYSWIVVTQVTGMITAGIVNSLIHYFSFVAVLFAGPILLLSYLGFRPYVQNIVAARRHIEELNGLHLRTLEAFATAVDAKDQITHEHVKRVQIYAEGVARRLNLSENEIQALYAGALLHDIGKIAVPDYILNKPGRLTAAEFDKMKLHTIVGAQILERINFPYPLVPIVRHHHERWDGTGYPDGLKGEAIPITARILTVVDCFDAVREDRQYRKGFTREEAIQSLLNNRGRYYDPQIVDIFLEHLPEFEAQIARMKKGEFVFKPLMIEETEAIRKAIPAAGLLEEKETNSVAYLDTIRAAHQSSQEILALYEIAQTFNSSLDITETMPTALKHLADIIPYDTAAVFLLDEAGGVAVAKFTMGANAEFLLNHKVSLGEGVVGWALANRSRFANTDPKLDLAFLHDRCDGYRTLAVQPLLSEEKKIGAVALYSKMFATYTEQQLCGLEQISHLFFDAISNAAQFEEVKEQAMLDIVTGLPNVRYLQKFVDSDMEELNPSKITTLMLLDVDNFKRVNQTVGRHRGDKALREIAELLRLQLRREDALVRHNSDKFLALLRNATPEVACEVAVRFQTALCDFKLLALEDTEIELRVSIGQAHLGIDGESLDDLIEVAERRLQSDRMVAHTLGEYDRNNIVKISNSAIL